MSRATHEEYATYRVALSIKNAILLSMTGKRSIFAQNLIKFRKLRGFSQGDLAEASGISRRMVGHYEVSETIPPLEKIESLAKALLINPAQLLDNSVEGEKSQELDLSEIDPRSIKKLKDILSLPSEDRNDLYRILNKMVRKNQLEKERKAQ